MFLPFLLTRDAIRQHFSFLTATLVNIIIESPHLGPTLIIYGKPYITPYDLHVFLHISKA